MAAEWDRIKNVFDEAARLEPPQHETFLDQVCAGDAQLRRKVESLLRSSEDDSGAIKGAIADAAQIVVESRPRTIAAGSLIGTTILHMAAATGVSPTTIDRELRLAKAWMKRELSDHKSWKPH